MNTRVASGARVIGHVGRDDVGGRDDLMGRYRRVRFELAVTALPTLLQRLTDEVAALRAELRELVAGVRRSESRGNAATGNAIAFLYDVVSAAAPETEVPR